MSEGAQETSTAQRVARTKEIISKLGDELNNALTLFAMLMRANENEELRRAFNNTYEGHGLAVLRPALMNQLILTVLKMHDPFWPDQRRTHNRASLLHVTYLLSKPDVVDAFADEARNWVPELNRGDEDAQLVRDRVAKARDAISGLQTGEPQTWLRTLRSHRDRYLAHSLFDMTPADHAKFGYIRLLIQATIPVVEDLRLAVLGEHIDPSDVLDINERMAEAFWNVATLGMATKKTRDARSYGDV